MFNTKATNPTTGMVDRPRFVDTYLDNPALDDYDVVEPKYDGMWAEVRIHAGTMQIYSRHAGLKRTFDIPQDIPDMILLGEYLFGQNWGIRNGLDGMLFLFDAVYINGLDLTDDTLHGRRGVLEQLYRWHFEKNPDLQWVKLVPQMSNCSGAASIQEAWNEAVITLGFEGIVFKKSTDTYLDATWPRCKRTFTMDYVCMGFNEGGGKYKGMAGSIRGGLYVDGVLTEICSVGGLTDIMRQFMWSNPDDFVGRVFEARGFGLFPSGALRHPSFLCFRDDKPAQDCKL